jgi:hypothetical protein
MAVLPVLNYLSNNHRAIVTKLEYFFGVSVRTVATVCKNIGLVTRASEESAYICLSF